MSPREGGSHIDPAQFRHVLSHFATGVAVITAAPGSDPVGMSAQSLVALSLDPPLVLFCPSKASTTRPRIQASGHFAVNILAADQRQLSAAFAKSAKDKFLGVEWQKHGVTGAPPILGALGE